MEPPTRPCAPNDNSQRKNFDWMREPRPDDITPFQKLILDVDWEKSPLGPIKQWSVQLRQMVLLIVRDPSPAAVHWGDNGTIVYNEPYTQLIGQKHPALQGQDPKIGFAEIWDYFEKLLAKQRVDAETVVEANVYLLLLRHGFLEETYFSYKFVPIIGEDGWVVGSHTTIVEVTQEVIRDRRMALVRHLSRHLSGTSTLKDLWSRLLYGIEDADKDIPLSLLYSTEAPIGGSRGRLNSSVGSTRKDRSHSSPEEAWPVVCNLEGATGIPSDHDFAPKSLGSHNEEHWLVPLIQQAMKDRSAVQISLNEQVLNILDGLEWRGHGVASRQVVVCPIIPTDSDNILAFLVVFLNPRRSYDEDYRNWLHLLTQQVTTPQLSAVILRQEVDCRQGQARLAALDRERLFRELTESETKFARFATRAPIGLGILTPAGTALSGNELWRDLTQLEAGSSRVDWAAVLTEDQLEPVQTAWDTLLKERRSLSLQTTIRRPWRAPDLDANGNVQYTDTEILLAMHPDLDDNGEVYSVMSCITDISSLKWSERQLQKKMEQAIEMKKQQERFIDMTSHEMRNPLSALIGCADEIITSLNDFCREVTRSSDPSTVSLPCSHADSLHLVTEAIQAADIIIYCAMHQKRIIDDILTLSRLDSNLLLVSPEPSQPVKLIRSALKMFEAELRRAAISLSIIEEPSLKSLNISWTLLDPSRVLQVLINLMTNAIKFTRTERLRKITVTMSASLIKPSERNLHAVQFVQKANGAPDQTSRTEWGDGEVIFFSIAVEDTGRGLTSDEISNLFHIFAQASPKTHQTYGGSGLGLFICRQLVEMQGGEIGVKSEAGKGSTFQFYVKTRRTPTPPPSSPTQSSNEQQQNGKNAPNTNTGEERERNTNTNTNPEPSTKTQELKLLVREDALREACAVGGSTLPSAPPTPPLIFSKPSTPSYPTLEKGKQSFHILVVEDNLVNQKVVSKQLRKAGHVVSVANHGEEAIAFLKTTDFWLPSPIPTPNSEGDDSNNSDDREGQEEEKKEKLDVLLMDLEMPVMDGISCVRTIRELQAEGKIKGHVPVIAVTANARKDQITLSLEAGMDDVMTKPYRINDMLREIERLVGRRQIDKSS